MSTGTQQVVSKAWNFAHVLRDDGLSCMAYVEQITFLLFLKMADEQTKPPYNRKPIVPAGHDWAAAVKGDSHQIWSIWRTQRVQVNVASLRLFLRSFTGPNRAFEPQSLGRVRDPVRIAEGPTHDFGFSILDFGLRTETTRVSLPEAPARGEGFLVNSLHEGKRTGPRTLWCLENVDGPHVNEKGGLNLANLTDEQHSEAEDDYRICVRRGRDEETKPKRQGPKTME